MLRSEFFTRSDLSSLQKCYLDFYKAFYFMLRGIVGALEQNFPDAAQQAAHQCGVLDEVLTGALEGFFPRSPDENKRFADVLFLGKRAAWALQHVCEAAAAPLDGLDEGRLFLASLCAGLADEMDWSNKRRLLGTQHDGAARSDLELSLGELTGELAAERRPERVQTLLDFRDALRAMQRLFDLTEELTRLSDVLFPTERLRWR